MAYEIPSRYFDQSCDCASGTGLAAEENTTDQIIRELTSSARALFPAQTAEAEAWIAKRAVNYGIDYAKYQAQQGYSTINEWLSNPIILLALGLGAGWLVFRRR